MTIPIRLQLSRRAGFDLQALSRASNGLPAVNVARPGLFGNPFIHDDASQAVEAFREKHGGKGPAYIEALTAYAASEEEGLKVAHERFRFSAFGWAVNSEVPTVEGFEAAAKFVRPEDIADSLAAGPDPERHLEVVKKAVDAGFDHVVLTCPGDDQAGFLNFFEKELRPKLDKLR